jgi:hypothetical protein
MRAMLCAVLRRAPFSLPYPDAVPALSALLRGEAVAAGDARLAAAARHHNVVGFVLEAADDGRVPLPNRLRRELADDHARAVLRSSLLRRELGGVLEALAPLGREPILLKGPAVADRYYATGSLRPFADLDLLLPRDALGGAVEALEPLGFTELEEFRPGFAEEHGHDVHLVARAGRTRVDVELHWRVGDDPAALGLDHGRLARTVERLEVGAAVAAVPAPAEQLLVLAVHLLSDRAKRLAWVNDLALVARSASEDEWNRSFALAGEVGLAWVLHRALDYPGRLLELERPRPLPAGSPPRWGPLRAVEELDLRASTHVGRLALLSWRGRARYLRDVLIPTRAGLTATVGGDDAPTWRLVGRHAGRVIGGLRPRRM